MWNRLIYRYLILIISGFFSCVAAADLSTSFKQADPSNLTVYMNQIIRPGVARNYKNVEELNRISARLKEQMRLFGIPCNYQTYEVYGKNYRNVLCYINVGRSDKIIIGAHYDAFEKTSGADANASGVAGVLEIARLLAAERSSLKHNIEFVFYTLKEQPFFKTAQMGSYIHAKSVQQQKEQIKAAFILDMIGYYDIKNVQQYPAGMKWIYPSHANFIATLSNIQSSEIGNAYCASMQKLNQLDCQRMVTPSFLAGADFSDHFNYWQFDIPAILITDTGKYRNKFYHTQEDRIDKLDTVKMAQVINGLASTILESNF